MIFKKFSSKRVEFQVIKGTIIVLLCLSLFFTGVIVIPMSVRYCANTMTNLTLYHMTLRQAIKTGYLWEGLDLVRPYT